MLRGVEPERIEKRLKLFMYGEAGTGKTTAAIQFPKPYLIDCERGAENDQYIKHLKSQGGAIFQTDNLAEIIKEVKALSSEKHSFKTLIIDPLTVVYTALLEECAATKGESHGRHYGEANKRMKMLFSLLLSLDMNVVITSHSKNEYGSDMAVLGQTFDCYKKCDYLFDLVIRLTKKSKSRVAKIIKTRIQSFAEGDTFDFSYSEIAKRYDSDLLERDAVATPLVTDKHVTEFKKLITDLGVSSKAINDAVVATGFKKVSLMPVDIYNKLVLSIKNKSTLPEEG